MSFTRNTLNNLSSNSVNGSRKWIYTSTTDNLATITAAGYFNNAWIEFRVNDLIDLVATDGTANYQVTAVSFKSVTITAVGSGGESIAKLATVTLEAAQIRSLISNPAVIVPAQGANTMIRILNGCLSYNFNSIAYVANSLNEQLTFAYSNSLYITNFALPAEIITATSDKVAIFQPGLAGDPAIVINDNSSSFFNQPITLVNVGFTEYSSGDGTLTASVVYIVEDYN